ncbi:MAG: hypothetical protein DDT18_01333 [Actinobacteria bacterium]|nr:hypothetical protein [Actinomycetota bacterium]
MDYKVFKAYDIRGKYPNEINEKVVAEITNTLGRYFLSKVKGQRSRGKIVIGRDARLSSPELYRAAIEGIMNNVFAEGESPKGLLGIKNKKINSIIHNSKFIIHKAGLITTPMLYFLVNHFNADLGMLICYRNIVAPAN